MKNSDMPAMPLDSAIYLDPTKPNLGVADCHGLTKREYFAAMAMQGINANEQITSDLYDEGVPIVSKIAKMAVVSADSLLAELDKPATEWDSND
jgi:hypothetical protein